MSAPLIWLCIAFSCALLEMLIGSQFFLLWLAVAALITSIGLTVWPLSLSWGTQIVGFSLLSLIAFIGWWWQCQRHAKTQPSLLLNERTASFLGKKYPLSKPLQQGRGEILIDGTPWVVISKSQEASLGNWVEVVGVEDLILQVKLI